MQKPLDKEAEFLWESCQKEVTKKKCLKPKQHRAMQRHFRQGYTAIPCFCHTQASGKRRRIDNGKAAWTNEGTQYTKKFRLPHAFAPVVAHRCLLEAADE